MKESKILVVALIGLLLAGSLFIMGCADVAYAVGAQLTNTSCSLQNDCNGNSTYCGKTSCAAKQKNSSTRCDCF